MLQFPRQPFCENAGAIRIYGQLIGKKVSARWPAESFPWERSLFAASAPTRPWRNLSARPSIPARARTRLSKYSRRNFYRKFPSKFLGPKPPRPPRRASLTKRSPCSTPCRLSEPPPRRLFGGRGPTAPTICRKPSRRFWRPPLGGHPWGSGRL